MLYFIMGLIVGVVVLGSVWLSQTRGVRLTWYEWLIALAAIILAVLAVQNFDGSLQEFEPGAASLLLGLFGVPALVLALIDWFLVLRHKKDTAAAKP